MNWIRNSGGHQVRRVPSVGSGSDPDWIARSTASGVTFASRLDSSSQIAAWTIADSTADHIHLDTSNKPHSSTNGSLKFDILDADTSASGSISIPLPAAYGLNAVRWHSIRVKFTPQDAYQSWPPSASVAEASKIMIISRDGNGASPTGSNQDNETVLQVNNNAGMTSGYWQNNNFTAFPVEIGFSSSVNSSDLKDQPSIDRGASPLTGTNPDTGSAWSTNEQERARYGDTYGARSSPGAANWKPGIGDPWSGGFRCYPGEWVTLTQRHQIGPAYGDGSTGHRWSVWGARENQPYELLWDLTSFDPGSGSSPDYNGITLLPYTTGRSAGGLKVSSRTNNITGVTIHSVGLTTPTGNGVLEYTSSTGRFRWHGNGESFGSSRGFSTANSKILINVIASGESYLVIEKTGTLPGSDQTDTVTIASGRQDTQRNYCDYIFSTLPINAPGGYVPGGVSTLGDLAATMSAGSWIELTGTNLSTLFADTGNSGTIGYYWNKAAWNPVDKCIEFIGGDHHGSTPALRHIRYYVGGANDNQFIEATTPPIDSVNIGHGYDHSTVNPFNGDIYYNKYNHYDIMRKSHGGSSFSNLTAQPDRGYNGNTRGNTWWESGFTGAGTQGCLVVYNQYYADGQVSCYDPLSTTWFFDQTAMGGGGANGQYCVAVYSKIKNCVLLCAGDDNPRLCWRMNSDGTSTAMPNVPGNARAGVLLGNVNCDPVTGEFLVLSHTEFWKLNPSGSGTWTQLTGGRAPPAAVGDPFNYGLPNVDAVVSCPIPDAGVTAYITAGKAGGASPMNFWLYKHA